MTIRIMTIIKYFINIKVIPILHSIIYYYLYFELLMRVSIHNPSFETINLTANDEIQNIRHAFSTHF